MLTKGFVIQPKINLKWPIFNNGSSSLKILKGLSKFLEREIRTIVKSKVTTNSPRGRYYGYNLLCVNRYTGAAGRGHHCGYR